MKIRYSALMLDYLLSCIALALLIVAALLAWKRLAGPAATPARRVVRVVLTVLSMTLILGTCLYQVTKSRTFQLAGELVSSVETSEKIIALTFDDGPTPGYTEYVLEVLAAYDASATFYVIGNACEANPEQLAAIVAAGHEIGNHTYSHPRLYFLSTAAIADEIETTDAIIRASGYGGPLTFRMPGCKRLLATPLYLANTGRTTVTWNLEPDSIAEIANDPDALAAYVIDGARPGSIVLMHVMYEPREATRQALPVILSELSAEGYEFVTVSDLISRAE